VGKINNRPGLRHCTGWHKPLTHTMCALGCSHGNAELSGYVQVVCEVAAHHICTMDEAEMSLTSISIKSQVKLLLLFSLIRWDGTENARKLCTLVNIECMCINVRFTHWEDNVRHCSILQHECPVNAQASTVWAKTLYHEQDKQAEDVLFLGVCQKK